MDDETRQWLVQGIDRAKAGQRESARELLLRVVKRDERNAQAWLWLSGVVDTVQDRRVALENVLAIESDNAPARAGLDWLERQAKAQPSATLAQETATVQGAPVSEPPASSLLLSPISEPAGEPERCPYCGQVVAESDDRCLHCARRLTVRTVKRTNFPARVSLLAVAWVVQAVTDGMNSVLMFIVLAMASMAMAGSAAGTLSINYLQTWLGGSALSGKLTADLWLTLHLFIGLDAVSAAWSLVIAFILPARRPAAPAVGLFVAAFHAALAVISVVVGMSSLPVGLARLALTLLIGFLLLEALGDFTWESVRQRLELDPAPRSSMDYYTRGRYYRRIDQTAKAILHLERAVELAPQRYEFRVALGNAYYASGQSDRAAEQLRAALQINPAADDVRRFLDIVTARASSGNLRVV